MSEEEMEAILAYEEPPEISIETGYRFGIAPSPATTQVEAQEERDGNGRTRNDPCYQQEEEEFRRMCEYPTVETISEQIAEMDFTVRQGWHADGVEYNKWAAERLANILEDINSILGPNRDPRPRAQRKLRPRENQDSDTTDPKSDRKSKKQGKQKSRRKWDSSMEGSESEDSDEEALKENSNVEDSDNEDPSDEEDFPLEQERQAEACKRLHESMAPDALRPEAEKEKEQEESEQRKALNRKNQTMVAQALGISLGMSPEKLIQMWETTTAGMSADYVLGDLCLTIEEFEARHDGDSDLRTRSTVAVYKHIQAPQSGPDYEVELVPFFERIFFQQLATDYYDPDVNRREDFHWHVLFLRGITAVTVRAKEMEQGMSGEQILQQRKVFQDLWFRDEDYLFKRLLDRPECPEYTLASSIEPLPLLEETPTFLGQDCKDPLGWMKIAYPELYDSFQEKTSWSV